MIRITFLTLIFIFIPFLKGKAQSSIIKKDLSQYGQKLNKDKQYDSAIIVFKRSILNRLTNNNFDSLAFDQFNLGAALYANGKLEESLRSYLDAEKTLNQLNDSSSLRGKTYLNMGYNYKKQADYKNALKYLFQAEYATADNTKDRASAYNALGSTFKSIDKFKKALENYEKAYIIYEFLELPEKKAKALTNKANVYTQLTQFDQANKQYHKALKLKNLETDSLSYSTTLQNIGWMHLELKQYDSAEYYLLNTVNLKIAINDSINLANNFNQLGELYLDQKKFGKAFKYLNKALKIARAKKVLDKEREILFNFSEYYRIKENFQLQGDYLKKYIDVNNKILNEEKIKGIQELELNQQFNKINILESKVSVLLDDMKQRGTLLVFAFSGIFLLSLLLVSLVYYYVSLKKSKAQVETLKDEMQHRIKNHLQQLSSIIKLQSRNLKDEGAKEILKAGESRVNAMNIIHQMLYEDKSESKILIKEYIKELCDNLSYSYQTENKTIIINNDLESVEIDVDKTISIGLIINELVTNAIKYAENDQATIHINSKVRNTNLFLEISDNGHGLPDNYEIKSSDSFGLNLVKILTKQLKAEPNFFNRNGAVFQFSIPL